MSFLFLPLIGTVIVELSFGYLLGYRNKKAILSLIAVNILTNPILNLLFFINNISLKINYWYILFFLEILIVIFEWKIIKYLLKDIYPKKKFFKDIFLLNSFSCLIGIILSI